MTLFGMQVACSCEDGPTGMDEIGRWDGDENPNGFTKGRRYIWECPGCGHQVCINMVEMDEDEQ